MNENKHGERDANLGDLADDVGHPFDQTNGIVGGLDGDADDPDEVDERLTPERHAAAPVAAPTGGSPQGIVPVPTAGEPKSDADRPSDERDPDA